MNSFEFQNLESLILLLYSSSKIEDKTLLDFDVKAIDLMSVGIHNSSNKLNEIFYEKYCQYLSALLTRYYGMFYEYTKKNKVLS